MRKNCKLPFISKLYTVLSVGIFIFTAFGFAGCVTAPSLPSACKDCYHPTARMLFPQSRATMVQLNENEVLLIGGIVKNQKGEIDEEKSDKAAQIYNVKEDKFYPAGSMNFRRSYLGGHTATLLKDRRVLIIGGAEPGSHLAVDTIEFFDPKDRAFHVLSGLKLPISGHTSTLLPDGKVLVIGRNKDASVAVIFDPIYKRLIKTSKTIESRSGHKAILIEPDKVLVTGGWESSSTCVKSAEYYDLQKNRFLKLPDMQVARCKHDMVSLADKNIFINGPFTAGGAIELFNSQEKKFQNYYQNTFRAYKPLVLGENIVFLAEAGPLKDDLWDHSEYGYSEVLFWKQKKGILIGPIPNKAHLNAVFVSNGKVFFLGGEHWKRWGQVDIPDMVDTGYYINIADLEKLDR